MTVEPTQTAEVPAPAGRRPVLAFLANLFCAPIGHFYVGAARRGILMWLGIRAVEAAAFLLTVSVPGRPTLVVLVVTVAAAYLILPIDAFLIGRRRRVDFQPRPYNRRLVYVASVVSIILAERACLGVLRRHVQAFRMPSESMAPALIGGDFFLVDKGAYRARDPRRGDVIVFPYPRNESQEFVERIIGLPGEVIEIRSKQVLVNGQALDEPYAWHSDPAVRSSEFDPRDEFGPYLVPPGELFMMGDNRDNSNDSRFWGPVARRSVKGKAVVIYLSRDPSSSAVRWGRIGARIP